jgi:hypothetical protein
VKLNSIPSLRDSPGGRVLKRDEQPADLALLAMALHQLGQNAEARATLGRLRETMKWAWRPGDTESQGLLHETEALFAKPGKGRSVK